LIRIAGQEVRVTAREHRRHEISWLDPARSPHVETTMASSKSLSRTAGVGRRLRRLLGGLLAVGFGAAWWSFIPHQAVAAAVVPEPPRMGPCLGPVALNHETAHVPLVETPVVAARQPIKRVRKRVIVPVIVDQPPVVAVVDPDKPLIDINVPPIVLPPAPENEPIATALERIRTRPS
jgi:hypothetical protein